MPRNPKLEEFEIETKPIRSIKRGNVSNFFYDSNTGAFLGRTAESWGEFSANVCFFNNDSK